MSAQLRALETALRMAQVALARREAPRRPRDTAWHAEAEARYRAGETLAEIGAALGRSTGYICNVLHARGVPMRKRGGGGTPEQKREAGRKGGAANYAKHGREHYARIGRKGGRSGAWVGWWEEERRW